MSLCLTGGLYEALEGETGLSRAKVKRQLLTWLFGRPWHTNRTGLAVKRLFPGVCEAVAAIKRRSGDYAAFARTMQSVEAEVMVGGAAGWLVGNRPDIPFLTVHDSVLCEPRHVPAVEAAIKRAWRKRFGVEVHLKSAVWAPKEKVEGAAE